MWIFYLSYESIAEFYIAQKWFYLNKYIYKIPLVKDYWLELFIVFQRSMC